MRPLKGGDGGAAIPHAPQRDGVANGRGRWRLLIGPGLMTLVMLVGLVALGTWQWQRLSWKTALLEQIDRAEAAPAVPLPDSPAVFAKVRVRGRFRTDLRGLYGAAVEDTATGPQMGADLLMPLERQGHPPLLVDRGWVPQSRPQPMALPTGEVTVEGFIRTPEQPHWFSATDDLVNRHFYTLNPAAIGRALGLRDAATFVLVALGPRPAELYPEPAVHLPRPLNNHLSYALTWYGLALVLLVVFVVWSRKVLRS